MTLQRNKSGDVELLSHEHYEADAAAGTPLSSGAPTHAVIAYDASGNIVASTPVSFPKILRVENFTSLESEQRKLDEPVAVVVVRAPAATAWLAVVDAQMKELKRIGGADLKRQTLRQRASDGPWAKREPIIGNWLAQVDPAVVQARTHCPHVYVMGDPGGTGPLEAVVRRLFGADSAPPPSRLLVEQAYLALKYLSPLQCRALRAIAFVSDPEHTTIFGWQTSESGGLIFINAAAYSDELLVHGTENASAARWRAELQRGIGHEATHSLQDLLDFGDREVDVQRNWPSTVRIEAQQILDTHMFPEGNFIDEWRRVHRTFVKLGLAAEPWESADAFRATPEFGERLAANGFMTRYGATAYHDDLAEMASMVQTTELYQQFPESERRDFICKALRSMDTKYVSSKYVAGFTKLGFLKSLGVIEERNYDACPSPAIGERGAPDHQRDRSLIRPLRGT